MDEAAADVDAKGVLIAACERRLEEGRQKISADEEGRARARRTAGEERAAAEAKLDVSRVRLEQCTVGLCTT